MLGCAAADLANPSVRATIEYLDCRGMELASDGWSSFGPGTMWASTLSTLLVIMVASLGYRTMMSGKIHLPQALTMVGRMAVAVTLCTQWSAWETTVYTTALQGPGALTRAISQRTGDPSIDPLYVADRIDRIVSALYMSLQPSGSLQNDTAGGQAYAPVPSIAPVSADDARSLRTSASLLSAGGVAALAGPRLFLCIFLAGGPLFSSCLLFAHTRGIFWAWAGLLFAAAACYCANTLILATVLDLAEPQTTNLVDAIRQGVVPATVVDGLWSDTVLGLVCAIGCTAGFGLIGLALGRRVVRCVVDVSLAGVSLNPLARGLTGAPETRSGGSQGQDVPRVQSLVRHLERRGPGTGRRVDDLRSVTTIRGSGEASPSYEMSRGGPSTGTRRHPRKTRSAFSREKKG